MNEGMGKRHFFKIMLGDFEKRLRIPPYFVENFFEESSKDKVTIHDANGGEWDVGLERTSSDTFLAKGWSKFVKYHKLKQHEFVVFRYEGNMHFSVVFVFDTTACEKDCMDLAQPSPEPEPRISWKKGSLSHNFCHCKNRNNETKQYQKIKKMQGSSSSYAFEVKTEKEGSRRVSGGKGKHKVEQLIDVDILPQSKRIKTEPQNVRKIKGVKHISVYWSRKRGSRRGGSSVAEKAASLFRSKFPFFITPIWPSDIRYGHKILPAAFAREHLPRSIMNIMLHDPNEEYWVVVYIPGHDQKHEQRFKFVKGWSAFVQGNSIQVGDYCAFELVDADEFRVTIFRNIKMLTRN